MTIQRNRRTLLRAPNGAPMLPEPPDWHQSAACASVGGDLWYPEKGESAREGQRICEEVCPVKAECLAWAIDNDEREGTWGGLTANQRKELRRGRPAPPTRNRRELTCVDCGQVFHNLSAHLRQSWNCGKTRTDGAA